jgi:pimeloyl-ACP methyl ester carboxylesterase
MADLIPQMVQTSRLAMNVWTSGPEDGRPVLLIHGNLTTGGFWRYVADLLPGDVRVLAPDMRGFGRTEQKPIDATRGLGDMVDDVHGLLEALGLTPVTGVCSTP